uniref:Uncharacterized protein n=1 Tax=Trichuris muris TaxID=70415 RepID=A0A5S6QUB0_TRIMR
MVKAPAATEAPKGDRHVGCPVQRGTAPTGSGAIQGTNVNGGDCRRGKRAYHKEKKMNDRCSPGGTANVNENPSNRSTNGDNQRSMNSACRVLTRRTIERHGTMVTAVRRKRRAPIQLSKGSRPPPPKGRLIPNDEWRCA